MTSSNTSYKQILKATSIFGGAQFFNIIVNIIKTKFVAVLLGPSGVGVLGLFNSTLELIKSSTSLGLSSSAVRDVASANASGDIVAISAILKTLNRWLFFTGLFGSILTISLAHYLSLWTFGSDQYSLSFVWLSVVLFLSALSTGQLAALQGLQKISSIAKVAVFGSL